MTTYPTADLDAERHRREPPEVAHSAVADDPDALSPELPEEGVNSRGVDP